MTEPFYFEIDTTSKTKTMVVCQKWTDAISNYIKNNRIEALYLNDSKGWKGDNLSFLKEHKHLKYFKIIDWDIEDISDINELNKLSVLKIYTYCKTKINFNNFPDLKQCVFEWRNGCDSLFDCGKLEYLFLLNYSGKQFEPLSKLANLVELRLSFPKFKTLDGIEKLTQLKDLDIASRHLESFDSLSQLQQLESLTLHSSKKITRIDPIAKLTNLKNLTLDNLGDIETLKPLAACTALEKVIFLESTKILDGKIMFLKELPNLKIVTFENRKHYDAKRAPHFQIAPK